MELMTGGSSSGSVRLYGPSSFNYSFHLGNIRSMLTSLWSYCAEKNLKEPYSLSKTYSANVVRVRYLFLLKFFSLDKYQAW